MDIYTQLENKLHDMTHRLTQEAKYFQMNECKPQQAGGAGDDASKKRFPLVQDEDGITVLYPHPATETSDSLAVRAQLSATALINLNAQMDGLLGTLPEDEGVDDAQMHVLQQLAKDNDIAGENLRTECTQAQELLVQVREALRVMGDDRAPLALATLKMQMELAARGLAPMYSSAPEHATYQFQGSQADNRDMHMHQ